MATVSIDPPRPRAPTPKVLAMRKVIRAFAELPIVHDLGQMNEFETLFKVIDDTVVAAPLLRTLYIEFFRGNSIELQVRFKINWQTRIIDVASGTQGAETLMLPKGADALEGDEFLRAISLKFADLHAYVKHMIDEGSYDSANWTVELRDNDRNKDIARSAKDIEHKYALVEEAPGYLEKRAELEASQPIGAEFKKPSFRELILRIIQRK